MLKINKKVRYILSGVAAIMLLLVGFVIETIQAHNKYTQDVTNLINSYLHQQQYLLQRLGNNMLLALQRQDIDDITKNLRLYEDTIYSFAKQGVTIPVNIQLVSLNAPQLIIGSYGRMDNSALAPDEAYYTSVIDAPNELIRSSAYYKPEMPNYALFNLGIGIVDNQQNFLAQLDIRVAINALQEYITLQLEKENSHNYFNMYSFKLAPEEITQPQITLCLRTWSVMCLKYVFPRFLFLLCVGFLIRLFFKSIDTINRQKSNILQTEAALQKTKDQLAMVINAVNVQEKYANLSLQEPRLPEPICLKDLINDMIAVNAEQAFNYGIQIKNSGISAVALNYFNPVRVMQILSGILNEIINNMHGAGTIEVQSLHIENQRGYCSLEVEFKDNGFYEHFQRRTDSTSRLDIRCQGWQNIQDLVALEQGKLEHIHIPYTGNIIKLSLHKKVKNNVISLNKSFT